MQTSPWGLVNRARYPLESLDSTEGRELVDQCRRDLDDQALCLLPGFLHPTALEGLAAQANALSVRSITAHRARTAYGWCDNRGFAPDHPRRALLPARTSTVTLDMIPRDSAFRALFFFDALTEFIRRCLGFDELYCSACPYLALIIKVMHEEDTLTWHFDTNDGVVSLLLQDADEGGHFQYAPYIRHERAENYGDVKAVFEGRSKLVHQPPMAPGSLVLFRGRRSLHRVSPVGKTTKPRLIRLHSYDRKPDMVFPENTVNAVLKPDGQPHYGLYPH